MSTRIDTTGLSCPQPVLLFLNAIKAEANGPFEVLTDNDASRENVSRAAHNRGFTVQETAEGSGLTRLDIRKE